MPPMIGRPPSEWLYKFIDFKFGYKYLSAYDIAELMNLNPGMVRRKFARLDPKPLEYEIKNASGQNSIVYDIEDLKDAVLQYLEKWDDKDF